MPEMTENKIDDTSSDTTLDMANFLASSVHDMKNSVSVLIGGLEKTLASVDAASFPSYDGLVQMNLEAKRMNDKLVQLLALYKLGQNLYPFDPQFLSLQEYMQTIAAQNNDALKFQGIKLDIQVEPDLCWYFDEDLVNGIVGNALNNASRYASGCICLSAKEIDGMLELRVEDDGDGYPDTVLQESIDNMRSINFQTRSTGLGIYFSAIVARLHHNHGRLGEIKLENGGLLGGSCFILRLP
jgi:two-component system, OmpR family, sensor histidine kinase SenX3